MAIFFDERDDQPTPEDQRRQKICMLDFPLDLRTHDMTQDSLFDERVIRQAAYEMSGKEKILPGDIWWEVASNESGWRVIIYENPDTLQEA